MMVGDTHGNSDWLSSYIFPVAMTLGVDRVVVLGDFGAWEHTDDGVAFMNDCDTIAGTAGIPLFWLHGNHDKWSHTVATYRKNIDQAGFIACRESVFYIPQGLAWTWGGISFRSFGGAYSIDKTWRLEREENNYRRALIKARSRIGSGDLFTPETVPSTKGTLWFPEEEMTDHEMDQLLAGDCDTKDVILSHDKPLSSEPGWNRKDYPGCIPNQVRLDRALKAHKPLWWFHGHLHHHYTDKVRGMDWETTVIGLAPDPAARDYAVDWKRSYTWALLETGMKGITVRTGQQIKVNPAELVAPKMTLHIAVDH